MKTPNKKLSTLFISLLVFLMSFSQISFSGTAFKSPKEDVQVKAFSANLLFSIYDFNPKNMLERHKLIAKKFSGNGWGNFHAALIKSDLIQSILKNKYTVTTTPLSPPKIIKKGVNKGLYYWKVTFPAMIVFKNDKHQQVQYVNIKLYINNIDNKLKTESFIVEKGAPLKCEKTSEGIIITPSKK